MSTHKTYEYQTEVKKLLDIVIHSLYTNKDIFVRELISNASDALEKIRYLSLTEQAGAANGDALEIKIELSEKSNTFTIIDNGVGMTEAELIENLGTIAHSGSQEFLKKLGENKNNDAQLIGQFGVGFYSAFMVAHRVRVITRSYQPGSPGLMWESDGVSNYTISPEEGAKRGTRIILELKDDYKDYAKADTIKRIIKEYSNFVSFNISVNDEIVNTIKPIWIRNASEVTEEEYKEFYKFQENAFDEPFFWLHTKSDAPLDLHALLYFPKENMEEFGFMRMEPGVSLYSNRVLIMSKVKDLLPEYMRFVKGIVDSEDLPLNISRETLQDNRIVGKLGKFLTKRVISFLNDKAKDEPEKYLEFYKKFHMFIKEGANSDWENKEELAKLLRFESTKTEKDQLTTLEEYISRMGKDQNEIYYLSGTSRASLENSPYLETFKSNDVEVLFLYEAIDDFVMTSLREFSGKKLVSADQAKLKMKSKQKDKGEKSEKATEKEVKKLAKWIKESNEAKLEDVILSERLVDSPAILVNPDDMMTTQMQKILQSAKGDMYPVGKKVLEINPKNELIQELARKKADNVDESELTEYVHHLIDNAYLMAGLTVDNNEFVKRAYRIMAKALK